MNNCNVNILHQNVISNEFDKMYNRFLFKINEIYANTSGFISDSAEVLSVKSGSILAVYQIQASGEAEFPDFEKTLNVFIYIIFTDLNKL